MKNVLFFCSCSNATNTSDKNVFNRYKFLATFTTGTIVVTILYTTVLWKKNRVKVPRNQINLLTLNQTVFIRVWLTGEFYLVQLLLMIIPEEKILLFEMVKHIIVDNICYRFLIPLALVITTKKNLPHLWTERSAKSKTFYMTEQQRKRPREATNHLGNPNNESNTVFRNNQKGKFIYV